MKKDQVDIPVSDVTRNCHVHVRLRGMRQFRIRLWIATRLIMLAGKIAKIDVEFIGYPRDSQN